MRREKNIGRRKSKFVLCTILGNEKEEETRESQWAKMLWLTKWEENDKMRRERKIGKRKRSQKSKL